MKHILSLFREIVHRVYRQIARSVRKYEIDIDYSNYPSSNDGGVIFACNHSNSHDFYTIQEVFIHNVIVFAGSEGLDLPSRILFKLVGTVLIDRSNKPSCAKGVEHLIKHLHAGKNIVIFPEATWNIHPSKLLLPMKLGVIKIAQRSERPIVPVIFDYVECLSPCNNEMDIIEKCVVRFGTPIFVGKTDNHIDKLDELREQLATIRWNIWESGGLFKREEIDVETFSAHDQLKCDNGMFGFQYDWQREEQFIYRSDDYIYRDYPVNRVFYGAPEC